jgi:hypothetical protein
VTLLELHFGGLHASLEAFSVKVQPAPVRVLKFKPRIFYVRLCDWSTLL